MMNELLSEWQNRLGLQDWKIKLVDNCTPEEMTLSDAAGCTDWIEAIKTARIEIIDPKYYGERIVPFNYEKTLVHELLHLKLSLVSDNVPELQSRYMHQIIDDLARAFVDAKGVLSQTGKLPTDVKPVVRGKWIKIDKYDDESNVQCSACLEEFVYIDGVCYLCYGHELPLFCPNCGADMRGKANEEN